MTTVNNKYRYVLFCETENKNVLTVLESAGLPTAPSTCPNDGGHTITASSVQLCHVVYGDEVKIYEASNTTNNRYYTSNTTINIEQADLAETIKTITITFPMNISALGVSFRSDLIHRGDTLVVNVNEDNNIGSPSAVVLQNTAVISVTTGVLDLVFIGAFIKLSEGGTVNDCGRVVGIDYVNNNFTVETNVSISFTTGSSILLTQGFANINITDVREYRLGLNKIGGSVIPKNIPISLHYYNYSGGKKKLNIIQEICY